MKATLTDLRRNTGKIVDAIERNEIVTLSRRGREIALIVPIKSKTPRGAVSIQESPAFGMWRDRLDMQDPAEYVRKMRAGRFPRTFGPGRSRKTEE